MQASPQPAVRSCTSRCVGHEIILLHAEHIILQSATFVAAPTSWQITRESKAGNPVLCRVAWTSGQYRNMRSERPCPLAACCGSTSAVDRGLQALT